MYRIDAICIIMMQCIILLQMIMNNISEVFLHVVFGNRNVNHFGIIFVIYMIYVYKYPQKYKTFHYFCCTYFLTASSTRFYKAYLSWHIGSHSSGRRIIREGSCCQSNRSNKRSKPIWSGFSKQWWRHRW